MSIKEELQGRYFDAIFNDTGLQPGITKAASACTTITLQTVVDVLEGILKNETDGYAVADNAQKALTEYKQLLNQTK